MNDQPVPDQATGASSDTVSTQEFETVSQAAEFFRDARSRLFDINEWKEISEGLSSAFRLTDGEGNLKNGLPQEGDYICISIPGPGNKAGDGFDWVIIEMVEDERDMEAGKEHALIRVRPAESPIRQEGTAHFFEEGATSTFIVKREQMLVSAEVHGRNEKPNTGATHTTDKVRNTLVGTGAAAGMSGIQWKNLTLGLVKLP